MDFSTIGNLNTHLKTLKMKTQWDLKQRSGEYTSKEKKSLDEWLGGASSAEKAGGPGSHGDDRLRSIHQKLDAGGKLTPEERDYLQAKDPEAYRELVALEQEQKAYEQALRRCKTKEEVERLRMGRINGSLVTIKSIEHNPNIPLSKKLEIAMVEKRRVDAVAESTQRFVESGAYAELPTEAEEWQVRQEEMEENTQKPEEGKEPKEPSVESASSETAEKAQNLPGEKAEKTEFPEESKKTETESSELERKVRRARAKAGYAAAFETATPSAEASVTYKV